MGCQASDSRLPPNESSNSPVSMSSRSVAVRSGAIEREEFFESRNAGGEVLLMKVLRQRLERYAVRLDAVGPEVAAHDATRLLHLRHDPWQRQLEGIGLDKLLVCPLFGVHERIEKTFRRPWVPLIDVLP